MLNFLKAQDSNFLLILLVGIFVFFMYVLPALDKKQKETKEKFDETLSSIYKIDKAMCSPDCCSKQWPVSFDVKRDPRIKDSNQYVPNNFMCTGKYGTGCACITKEQKDYLNERGENN